MKNDRTDDGQTEEGGQGEKGRSRKTRGSLNFSLVAARGSGQIVKIEGV
jgi:hypothetical protein